MNIDTPHYFIATDLDGTLLRSDKTISQRTYTILQRVQQAGWTIALVSARPPRILRQIAQNAGVTGLAICCNGALVYDLRNERVVQHTPIDPRLTLPLIEKLRQELPGICFACERELHYICEALYYQQRKVSSLEARDVIPIMEDALVFGRQPLTKLIAFHPLYSAEELASLTASVISTAFVVTHSGAPFLEISAAGVHKGWAIATLCQQLKVEQKNVIAFGDMPNDLPMLLWAGQGIAVANAHAEVLAQADAITLSNDEDGVAACLETLLNDHRE